MKQVRKKKLYYQSNKGKSYRVRLYKAARLYTDWTKGKILEEKEEKAKLLELELTKLNIEPCISLQKSKEKHDIEVP